MLSLQSVIVYSVKINTTPLYARAKVPVTVRTCKGEVPFDKVITLLFICEDTSPPLIINSVPAVVMIQINNIYN